MTSEPKLSLATKANTKTANNQDFFNRELSSVAFNHRVLQLSQDEAIPLLERLRYLSIFSSNLDEFFEIRVSGLRERAQLDMASPYLDGRSPTSLLKEISERAHALIETQYNILNEELLPALEQEGIRVLKRDELSSKQVKWVRRYFKRVVMPVLSPIGLDPAHPFPNVQNKGLNLVVHLKGQDAFARESGRAILPVPRCLPRLIQLPEELSGSPDHFLMLSSVIHENVDLIFPGMKVKGCYQFRVTRNSDMWVDEDEADDLLSAIKGELHGRHYGAAVRLEVADNCPNETIQLLLEQHNLAEADVYQVKGPVNLHRVSTLADLVDRPDLKYPATTPRIPERLDLKADLFAALSEGNALIHHPYESYAPVVALLKSAASDPAVLAIKMTVYRTGTDSPVVDALINAARNGKEVTAVVELRARFDEAANIDLATRLQDAGAKVAYGVVGYKCHAKMMLIVRREEGQIKRYCHLGTGNYHTGTSRFYTDFSFLTADPDLCEDVHNVFMQLTSLGRVLPMNKLLHAPFTLKTTLIELIQAEQDAARNGKPAAIRAKLNSLRDQSVINALYAASQAGVQVDLVVRGICCLRPGVPGMSENIRVRSILGRFLEHARVYHFHSGGKNLVFIASADWMDRNLDRRVEVAVPITEKKYKTRVIREALDMAMEDNVNAWVLGPDGTYKRLHPGTEPSLHLQSRLVDELSR